MRGLKDSRAHGSGDMECMFWEMCFGKCVLGNVFCEILFGKCVLGNMFWEMCFGKCVLGSVFWEMCFGKCVLGNVFWEIKRRVENGKERGGEVRLMGRIW